METPQSFFILHTSRGVIIKTTKRTAIIAGVIIAIIAILGFTVLYPPEEPGGEGQGQVQENIQDLLTEAVAGEKGTTKENVMICFYQQTSENNVFAVGAVIRGAGSIVFFYDNSLRQITQTENAYAPTTNEEYQALSIAVGKISPWTGVEIVPINFTKADNTYSFKFYDGYNSLFSRWSYGWATLYLDNEAIEWGIHTM